MLLKDFIKDARAALAAEYSAPEACSVVEILCAGILGVNRQTHIIEPTYAVAPSLEEPLLSALGRIVSGEPVQYVLGSADFYGRRFRVTPDVLIPRQETELLCEGLIRRAAAFRAPRILDLCTGSGCIAWTLAAEIPGAEVVGVDISREALSVAMAQKIDLPEGCRAPRFVRADVLDLEHFPDLGLFDIVVSNPPYIMESEKAAMGSLVLDNEPALALFVSDSDPLVFYRAVARICQLVGKTFFIGGVEINEALGGPTAAIFKDSGFENVVISEDFALKSRDVFFEKRPSE